MRRETSKERAAWTEHFSRNAPGLKLRRENKQFAKGRLKSGERNKTEAAYEQYLETKKKLGLIRDYGFQRYTLRIAPGLTYTPDFDVLENDFSITIIDTKGRTIVERKDGTRVEKAYSQEDSKVKIKVCAAIFPFRFVFTYKSKDGSWAEEEF